MAELQPGVVEITEYYYSPHKAEAMICKEALSVMKGDLSRMLSEDTFDPALAPEMLRDSLAPKINDLVPEALREEREWGYTGSDLHAAFGLEYIQNKSFGEPDSYWQGPVNAVIPEDFAEDLLNQVANLDLNFDLLAQLHDDFADTSILRLVQNVNSLVIDTQPNATDQVYAWVKEALYSPDYTLPVGKEEALYLLCFLPFQTRRMVKGALIANQIVGLMNDELEDELTDTEVEMLSAFKLALATDSLIGQDWYQLAERSGVSEQTAKEMAILSADRITALANIQKVYRNGGGERVVEAYLNAKETLNAVINNTARESDVSILANTDIGHAFEGFRDHEISGYIGDGDLVKRELVEIHKNGLSAVIFEDDPEQSARWSSLVNDHTVYTSSDAEVFATMHDIDERIDNLSVGMFLIDIQNGSDETAGIRLAEEILRRRIRLYHDPDHKNTNIIVWSTSPEHVKLANNYFKDLLKSDDETRMVGISTSFLGSGSSGGGNRIKFDVRHKLWNDITDTPKEYTNF